MNVAGLRRNIKNIAHNYTDAQVKVREATSNDPWGPPSSLMSEISDLTYNVVAFSEIMQMIWKRLNDHGKNYRHVYKALVLLDYLVKTGNEKVAQQCKENIFAIHTLRDFQHYEEGKDQGINVREKAKQLEALLKDDERLKNERVKALKARERFAQQTTGFGIGSDSNELVSPSSPTRWDFTGSRSESFGSDPGVRSARPAAAPSDLDLARPQTAGEEELQLQLALAMSREEAEKEEERRRSDDVRLALAMAQSQEDGSTGVRRQSNQQQQQGHLLDLLDDSASSDAAAGWVDPWGTPAHPSEPPAPVMPPRPKAKTDFMTPAAIPQSDAWGMPVAAAPLPPVSSAQVDPWGSPSSAAANKVTSNSNLNQLAADPWAPTPVKSATGSDPWSPQPPLRTAASSNDPWSPASGLGLGATASDVDGFDLLTTRAQAASPIGHRGDPLSANGSSSPFDLSAMEGALSPSSASNTGARPKKSPESFLGPNSNLVNLENLVPAKPSVVPAANPFALTGGGQPNPFQQPPAPRPSINELRNQQTFGVLGSAPATVQPVQPVGVWGSPVAAAMPPTGSMAPMPLMGGGIMQSGGQNVTSPTFNPFLA